MGGRKIHFSGEMAGYYVLSPFKLTIVRNSITLDNATQYNDSNRKDSENNSITIPIKEAFIKGNFHEWWILAHTYGTI